MSSRASLTMRGPVRTTSPIWRTNTRESSSYALEARLDCLNMMCGESHHQGLIYLDGSITIRKGFTNQSQGHRPISPTWKYANCLLWWGSLDLRRRTIRWHNGVILSYASAKAD
jgi:hypothetical protein